jgi:signal transduction histidine kinase
MLGQMTVLSVLFVGFIGYYFGLRPMLSLLPDDGEDQLQLTSSRIGEHLSQFALTVRTQPGTAMRLDDAPLLREVHARNPNFHYYVKIGEREYGDSGASYFKQMGLHDLQQIKASWQHGNCLQMTQDLSQTGSLGQASYIDCSDGLSYYEYYGLTQPLPRKISLAQRYPHWVWSYSGNMLLAAAGVLLIVITILVINIIMIRRIALLTRSFHPHNLEQKLPERGLPIEVVPLVQAVNEMISKLDASQKQHDFFLSTAAHEMRTPLTILRTRLEMLEDTEVKQKLVSDVGRLTSLANQLLRLMSISSTRQLDTLVDLVACSAKVISERSLIAEARGVALQLQTSQSSCRIIGEPGLIEVAIANLVDNAISFSEAGTDVVLQLDTPARLTVRDHGRGIDRQQMATLFEPFSKFPPNRNGHGLGLAIVKAIAELHGAEIHARNNPEGGSCFELSFNPVE